LAVAVATEMLIYKSNLVIKLGMTQCWWPVCYLWCYNIMKGWRCTMCILLSLFKLWCSHAPFHLTRRGWGEFPVRVQLHFRDGITKSVDIIHKLTVCCTQCFDARWL